MTRHRESQHKGFEFRSSVPMSSINLSEYAVLTNDEKKIFSALPFFGGTSPEGGTTTTDTGKQDDKKNNGNNAGGDQGNNEDNPLAKLQSDPIALQQLLDQNAKTAADLANATKERDTLAQEKDKATRAQQTKEQNLETDLANAQAQVEAQHEIIEDMAKTNAFLTASAGIQWNSVKQAMAELDSNNFSVTVDTENRKAEVEGMENEAKRIAKDFPWLVKNNAEGDEQQPQRGPGRPRTTGTPPAPPKGNQAKAEKRSEMMNRFPVLMQGR